MSYEVSVVANYHKGEAFPFQLLIFLFTNNYLNTRFLRSAHKRILKREILATLRKSMMAKLLIC